MPASAARHLHLTRRFGDASHADREVQAGMVQKESTKTFGLGASYTVGLATLSLDICPRRAAPAVSDSRQLRSSDRETSLPQRSWIGNFRGVQPTAYLNR